MLGLSLLSWWYGQGWVLIMKSFGTRLKKTADAFSIKTLLRTLFAPWKRIISYPGSSLNDRLHAALDNLVSRVVGFVVRISVLIAASIAVGIIAVATIIELVVWPLLPVLVIYFLIKSVL